MRAADTFRSTGSRRLLAAVTALAGTLLLGACGGGADQSKDEESTGVASVTGPTKGTGEKPAKQVERPLVRPDSSDEEQLRVWRVYYDCMAKQGVEVGKNKEGDLSGIKDRDKDPKFPAGQKKCGHLEPETPSWRSAREDPDFRNKADKWVKCMRSHGAVATVGDDGMFALDDATVHVGLEWSDKCEAEVFLAK